jgi:hypothetical protein
MFVVDALTKSVVESKMSSMFPLKKLVAVMLGSDLAAMLPFTRMGIVGIESASKRAR